MALTKPILYFISAFDATNEKTFNFNVVGGDQVVKNQLTIIKQSDNTVVYQQTQTTFSFRHVLPANSLVNGEYYSAYIITYNSNNDASTPSSGIQFYCFSTPSFAFSNLPVNRIINNSSYSFDVTYNQTENEMLNNYVFNLYDVQRNLLVTSGELNVGGSSILPLTVSHLFSGMDEDGSYFIQATGQTIHGMQVDTGLIFFNVKYLTPNVFSIIELTNNCEGGYISVQSNLISIEGESNPSPPNYVDNNTAVDITGSGEYILWKSGYSIDGDFTASLWGRDFNDNSTIITMSDGLQTLMVRYWKDEDGFYYVELIVQEGSIIYYIYSDAIYIYPNDEIQIWFRRVGYLYEVGLYDLTERPTFVLNSPTEGLIGVNILG